MTYTLQTFAIFLTLFTLGGKWGSVSIGVYLLLGMVGLPVFSGFRGGVAALVSPTGGFLWGFALSGMSYWYLEKWHRILAAGAGLLVCYACGCSWYMLYVGNIGLAAAAVQCVIPYLVPDLLKLVLAFRISKRLKKAILSLH